jgi:hypothetical protein
MYGLTPETSVYYWKKLQRKILGYKDKKTSSLWWNAKGILQRTPMKLQHPQPFSWDNKEKSVYTKQVHNVHNQKPRRISFVTIAWLFQIPFDHYSDLYQIVQSLLNFSSTYIIYFFWIWMCLLTLFSLSTGRVLFSYFIKKNHISFMYLISRVSHQKHQVRFFWGLSAIREFQTPTKL